MEKDIVRSKPVKKGIHATRPQHARQESMELCTNAHGTGMGRGQESMELCMYAHKTGMGRGQEGMELCTYAHKRHGTILAMGSNVMTLQGCLHGY